MAPTISAKSAQRDAATLRSLLQAKVNRPTLQATAPRPSGSQKSRISIKTGFVCCGVSHIGLLSTDGNSGIEA
jgi:hypothetical protein